MNHPTHRLLFAALLAGGSTLAFAQTAADPSTATASEQPIVLSTFTVDVARDRGYIAVDSLAGGRTNTPIRFTPSAMSSLTRTFIDDLALTNVRDALRWTLNVVPSDWNAGKQSSNPFNAWDYNFRGAGQSLQGGAGPMRNYFTFYQVADAYNIERIEADRGPNSILFGVGTVGGVLSIYTKVPRLEKSFTSATGLFDSHGSYRFELDTNQVIGDRVAVRVNAVDDHVYGWRNGDKNHFQAVDLAVLFKATDNTSVRVEVEGARSENTLISSTFAEAISSWNAATVADTWGQVIADSAAAGVTTMRQWGPVNYNVWVAGQPQLGVQDWAPGLRSAGTSLPVAPSREWYPTSMVNGSTTLSGTRLPVLPEREFTFGSGLSTPKYTNLTAFIDHSFNEHLDAQLSYYRYTDSHRATNYEGLSYFSYDLNRQLPNGQANPNFGKPFGDFFLSRQLQDRTVSEYRAQLNYHFDAQPFGVSLKQRFSVAAGDQRIRWHARQRMAQIANSPSTRWEDRMIWGRLYIDQANTRIELPTQLDNQNIVYAPLPFDWFDFDEAYNLESISFMSQSLLWDDRVSVLLGAREDRYDHRKIGANPGSLVEDDATGTT
ncbi:MAG TPA: TonB-dependent receptor plug domain-containing protein [Opitutus sp.]|nr:TonB-dependent receptor plug domain-containing protein [Opitutus sp.]